MVQRRDDVVGLDSSVILAREVWEASGHVATFVDPLTECQSCHKRFRADHLEEAYEAKHGRPPANGLADVNCPNCGTKGAFTEPQQFNGPAQDPPRPGRRTTGRWPTCGPRPRRASSSTSLNVQPTSRRKKPPFGIAQIGKSFRNEITPGNFIFRTREFEQMEMEFFVKPGTDEEWHEYWMRASAGTGTPASASARRTCAGTSTRRRSSRHYSKRTVDIEYRFRFGGKEWGELEGVANRTDFDLDRARQASGQDLSYFDQETGERWTPYVIEPAAGVDRAMLAFLLDAYTEDEAPNAKGKMEKRTVLRLDPRLAPVKVAVLPLSRNADLSPKAGTWRPAAAELERRVRRRRRDRPPLPPPGRDRYAVLRHGRLRHAGGQRGDGARAGHDEAGAGGAGRGARCGWPSGSRLLSGRAAFRPAGDSSLVDGSGVLLGTLPPYDVEVPWWPEAAPVVAGARREVRDRRHGASADRLAGRGPGGGRPGCASPGRGRRGARPAAGAVAGGPRATRWPTTAAAALRPGRRPGADLRHGPTGSCAAQADRARGRRREVQTWNLSNVCTPSREGPPGDRVNPPDFGHEGAMLGRWTVDAAGAGSTGRVPGPSDSRRARRVLSMLGLSQWDVARLAEPAAAAPGLPPTPDLPREVARWLDTLARIRTPPRLLSSVRSQAEPARRRGPLREALRSAGLRVMAQRCPGSAGAVLPRQHRAPQPYQVRSEPGC